MVFYVTMVTFLMTLLMNKLTSIVMNNWVKPKPLIGAKCGILCIPTFL